MRLGPGHALVEVDQVALVDARRRRVDDHEHLGGEVFAAPVENHARNVDRGGFVGPVVQVEAQRGEAVLAVDDQEFLLRLGQVADAFDAGGAEAELFGGEQEDRARDRRLRDRRFVEVLERLDLGLGQRALERLVGALDLGDELGDLVLVGDFHRGDFLALAVEAADETHLAKQVLRRDAGEVKNAVFLAYLRGKHGDLPLQVGRSRRADRKYSRVLGKRVLRKG